MQVMHQKTTRLEEMESRNQGNVDGGDVSEPKIASTEEEEHIAITPEMIFLKLVLKSSSKLRPEIPIYQEILNPEELIDQINDMKKLFNYEEMEEEKKVKFVVTKLKGHETLWWDGVQVERRRLGKQPIINWNMMVEKLRGTFLPSDYHLSLFRKMHNLRQRLFIVKEYKEEFYKVSKRAKKIQDT